MMVSCALGFFAGISFVGSIALILLLGAANWKSFPVSRKELTYKDIDEVSPPDVWSKMGVKSREVKALDGGWSDMDVEGQEVKELARFATEKVNDEPNVDRLLFPLCVLEAKAQALTGARMAYELEMCVGESTCNRRHLPLADHSHCEREKEGVQRSVYKVRVYEKAWENFRQASIVFVKREIGCECPDTLELLITNGWRKIAMNSQEVEDATRFAMRDVNALANDDNRLLLPLCVLDAKSQVLGGNLYELEICVGESLCKSSMIGNNTNHADCAHERSGEQRGIYTVRVHHIPWKEHKDAKITFALPGTHCTCPNEQRNYIRY